MLQRRGHVRCLSLVTSKKLCEKTSFSSGIGSWDLVRDMSSPSSRWLSALVKPQFSSPRGVEGCARHRVPRYVRMLCIRVGCYQWWADRCPDTDGMNSFLDQRWVQRLESLNITVRITCDVLPGLGICYSCYHRYSCVTPNMECFTVR